MRRVRIGSRLRFALERHDVGSVRLRQPAPRAEAHQSSQECGRSSWKKRWQGGRLQGRPFFESLSCNLSPTAAGWQYQERWRRDRVRWHSTRATAQQVLLEQRALTARFDVRSNWVAPSGTEYAARNGMADEGVSRKR